MQSNGQAADANRQFIAATRDTYKAWRKAQRKQRAAVRGNSIRKITMTKIKAPQPVNAIEIAGRVASITAELAAAKSDVALLQRLKDAEANADRLTDELASLHDSAAKVQCNVDNAKRQEAFARIRNMSITAITPTDNPNASLLQTRFAVSYETVAYDSGTRCTVWRVANAPNINHLPNEALAYLTEAKPELIPAGIMALAPDSPTQAIRTFIQGIRRGYLVQ
jgi:hypothetical protein